MSIRNEIIERLENLAEHAVHRAGEPPFVMSLDDGIALHEAIDLLKAREPRVMTRAELELAKLAPVWLDTYRSKIYTGWALCYDIQTGMGITGTRAGITDPSGRVHWLKLDDYGRTWRCWTSRPTDAQREATPWRS